MPKAGNSRENTICAKIIKEIDGLTLLNIPVPPMLAKAIGYIDEAWSVSFQWTPYGYQAVYSAGRLSGTGSWMVFHAYIRHSAVSPLLQEYDLGNPIAAICATLGISKAHALPLYRCVECKMPQRLAEKSAVEASKMATLPAPIVGFCFSGREATGDDCIGDVLEPGERWI